ncbi:hypothetical protein [Maritimibacter sp. HL-12]|uniref:hypothetical protein n=1 Tax=Maritimibacter sp. HL-12 TaxID=1162418 RepID=UPI0015934FCB|nr:hypothetical protein [Maritimibacter sp. HL-12]
MNAQAAGPLPCDQVSLEVVPRSAHWAGFSGFEIKSNGLEVSCGFHLPLSDQFTLVTGFSAMSFVNSFDVQSYAVGTSAEVQYRPDALDNFGLYAGLDGGVVLGYDGFFPEDRMVGPFTFAGNLKGGVLFDIPQTNMTLFGGVRAVPPVFGHRGIIAPGLGVTYRF